MRSRASESGEQGWMLKSAPNSTCIALDSLCVCKRVLYHGRKDKCAQHLRSEALEVEREGWEGRGEEESL